MVVRRRTIVFYKNSVDLVEMHSLTTEISLQSLLYFLSSVETMTMVDRIIISIFVEKVLHLALHDFNRCVHINISVTQNQVVEYGASTNYVWNNIDAEVRFRKQHTPIHFEEAKSVLHNGAAPPKPFVV
jgi:hypothetical protein